MRSRTQKRRGFLTTVFFTSRERIARIDADGTLDSGFDPEANGTVYDMALQVDGKVLLGGGFMTLQPNGAVSPSSRICFARLQNDPATQALTAPDAAQALWTRSGAAPDLNRVTFELSTNGSTTWIPLGPGTRIGATANWRRAGLTLPSNGQLRARSTTTGGYRNGSSGLIEQVATFSILAPIQQWKLTQLGDASAPDLGDTDFDGLSNLAEYALNFFPTTASRYLRVKETQ